MDSLLKYQHQLFLFFQGGKLMKTAFQWLSIVVFVGLMGLLTGCADCKSCPECTQPKKVCVPVTKRVAETKYVNEERTVCKKECVRKPITTCRNVTELKEKTICEPMPVTQEPCPPDPCPPNGNGTMR